MTNQFPFRDSDPIPALAIRNICHDFAGSDGIIVPVLDHIEILVGRDEILAIVGRSGAGKSTLFNIISGLLTPRCGRIEIAGLPGGASNSRIAYMLQKDLLLPWRSVLDNALLGIELRGHVGASDRQDAIDMLDRYGLSGQLSAYPHEISGGQRQRVALTRTLLLRPAVLLLDEPFSALDYETRLMLEDDVMSLRDGRGMGVVLVTHDIEEAIAMSDRVVVLAGRPARVTQDISISLTTALRRDAITAREAPEFRGYHARIWGALKSTVLAA